MTMNENWKSFIRYLVVAVCSAIVPHQLLHRRTRDRQEPATATGEQHLYQNRLYHLRADNHDSVREEGRGKNEE